jgi:hypothetical protein
MLFLLGALCFGLLGSSEALPQDVDQGHSTGGPERLTLVQAVMCESVKDYTPLNQGIVFSAGIGKVVCYTVFDPVPLKTVIYHNWVHADQLSSKQRLTLQPPRWSTFSSIQLREGDRGPWRVEVMDGTGHIFRVLRFSIVD